MTAFSDATTARDQLQDLAVRGFTIRWLADQIGAPDTSLGGIRSGRQQRARGYTLHRIYRLHRRLHDTTPDQHGIEAGRSAWTRLIAARNNWKAIP